MSSLFSQGCIYNKNIISDRKKYFLDKYSIMYKMSYLIGAIGYTSAFIAQLAIGQDNLSLESLWAIRSIMLLPFAISLLASLAFLVEFRTKKHPTPNEKDVFYLLLDSFGFGILSIIPGVLYFNGNTRDATVLSTSVLLAFATLASMAASATLIGEHGKTLHSSPLYREPIVNTP